jgi:hypothetical protein
MNVSHWPCFKFRQPLRPKDVTYVFTNSLIYLLEETSVKYERVYIYNFSRETLKEEKT